MDAAAQPPAQEDRVEHASPHELLARLDAALDELESLPLDGFDQVQLERHLCALSLLQHRVRTVARHLQAGL